MRQVLKPGELARYADTIVKGCLDFRRGEDLIIRADPAHRELTVALTEAAYRAGARTVDVSGDDPRVQAARYRLARNDAIGEVAPWQLAHQRGLIEPTTALAQISGDSEPEALANLSPERIAADVAGRVAKMPWYTKARREGKFRATIAPWPTEHWASKVYPELEPLNAQRKLAREILSFCRIAPGDPLGAAAGTPVLLLGVEAADRIEAAVAEAETANILGAACLGTQVTVRILVFRGAGAYICGEETALLESLEGRRPMPRSRPPFPAVEGLYRRPTVINNVETLANVPAIIDRGSGWRAAARSRTTARAAGGSPSSSEANEAFVDRPDQVESQASGATTRPNPTAP